MKLPANAKVTVPDGVFIQLSQGESVLLNVNPEYYFDLDEAGTRM